MNLINTLIREYWDISATLKYHIGKKNVTATAQFTDYQRRAAMKLIVAVAMFHGISAEEVITELKAESGQDA